MLIVCIMSHGHNGVIGKKNIIGKELGETVILTWV